MFFQLKDLEIWPTRDVVDAFMPENFSKFSKTRKSVILDATEIPINR